MVTAGEVEYKRNGSRGKYEARVNLRKLTTIEDIERGKKGGKDCKWCAIADE